MAKQALLDVLEQTIGRYVVDLDAQSLNVAVWSGHIELKALELNVVAVNSFLDRQAAEAPNLAIPFRVVSGNFGNFQIHVPWSQLLSQPVIAQASQLSVIIEPFDRSSASSNVVLDEELFHESESARAQKLKEQRVNALQSAEVFRTQTNTLKALAEQDIENTSQNNSFAARLVRRIVENLQIEISGVHITVQSTECSAGVVLGSLQLVTTDKDGKRTFVDRSKTNDAFLYKNLSITGLGIYLDKDSRPAFGGRRRHHEPLKSIVESKDEDGEEAVTTALGTSTDTLNNIHSYVLAPLSFDANFRQADSNTCVHFPKYKLNSELTSLDVSLSRRQLELANSILGQIRPTLDAPRLLFPEYRPLSRVTKETAVEWWKYAVRCIGRLNGRRSWVEFFRAFQSRKSYIELYKRHTYSKSCSWMQPLLNNEIDKMQSIETDRSIHVDAIMMWRNIADAQKRKEEEKHREASNSQKNKPSLFTSLFGGGASKEDKAESSPPITLTVEELKELEKLTMEQEFDSAESSLSSDSKLCEVQFVLGAFCIHLTSLHDLPLTSLEMGTVTSTFNANQDGSFIFDSALTSVEVEDRVTPRTRFPTILKNQTKDTFAQDALRVHMAKSNSGDQHLIIKLDTFEIVASPTLLLELRKFATLSSELTGPQQLVRTNPLLTQSLSGSVDLFYDAAQGNDLTAKDNVASMTSSLVESPFHTSTAGHDDLSKALIDAWRTKTENKASWIIDLDLHAPILIIPENCIDPRANVLIFNFGHLRFQYGAEKSSPKISKWFSDNPRSGENSKVRTDLVLDNGLVHIRHLTFSVGKTSYWRRLVHKNGGTAAPNDDEAIIEPVSLSMDFAVESADKDEIPRFCLMGTLPCLAVRLSASQCSRIMSVVIAWQQLQKDVAPDGEEYGVDTTEDDTSYATQSSFQRKLQESSVLAHRASTFLATETFSTAIVTRFNFDLRLQRLSAKILDNVGNSIEAHLVYVAVLACVRSDGSLCNNLTMGWFWILDRVDNEFPRRQRLVAHSTLPIAASDFAKEGKYDIIGELTRRGVFDDSFCGSRDLADIQFKQSPPGKTFGLIDPFSADAEVPSEDCDVSCILDVQFTNLFIYWNPQAVKAMLSMLMVVAKAVSSTSQTQSENVVVISDTSQISPRRRKHSFESIHSKTNAKVEQPSRMKLSARMAGLHISLNSARDDLPLFIGSMASACASLVLDGKNSQLYLALGEMKIETPALGKTLPCYRNILEIAPGESKSLLLIRYFDGPKAISSCPSSLVKDLSNYETYAEVELSPMKMIYIQAQVLSLVEFATAGILGALTAQAASSAANAAIELTTASISKKLFNVKASGFDLVIPQAAHSEKNISLHLGALCIDYIASPDSSGVAKLELVDVTMSDTESSALLTSPVRMEIDLELPPEGIGSKDDQAIAVEMDISTAHFLVSKEQYSQLLATLEENIGEVDLFLRETSLSMNTSEKENDLFASDDNDLFGNLTHAGIEIIDDPRRVRVSLQISNLALTLFSGGQDDSLLRLSAVTACVNFKTFPDCGRFSVALTLRDLECVDLRMKAMMRQHRSLIYQQCGHEENQELQDFFFVSYETHDDIVEMKVRLGSPRLVFIPDAISDVLTFLKVDRKQMKDESPRPYTSKEIYREVIAIDSDKDAVVEACFALEPELSQVSTLTFSLNTSQCTVILVDLGSDSLTKNSKSLASCSVEAEVIVIGGSFDSTLQMKTEKCSGKTLSYVSELHGDRIEVFTAFGRELHNAIQILDPTQLSCYVKYKEAIGRGDSLDIRCAVIAPLDVTLSIRNYALFNAIMTSASDCFVDTKTDNESRELNEEEMKRIEKLAIDLDSALAESDVNSHDLARVDDDTITTTKSVADPNTKSEITVKITTTEMKFTLVNDLQGLDEALVRVSVRNFIANGITQTGQRCHAESPVYTAFDFSIHTSVVAHYFDASYNDWRTLLLHPWELSAKGNRGSSQRFRSSRPSTTLDIESLPCHLSFSEQFLMSLASANRMWSIYSAASSSALESLEKTSHESLHVRKSMAASAARTFISSLPYAIENHCGVDIIFLINDEKKMQRICRTGRMDFFRFEPPIRNGSGGSRLYGQDAASEKSVTLLVGGDEIQLHHLDLLLGQPRVSHEVAGNIVMTEVIKEGKTTVSTQRF
jgi:vacuolar protein sorting-associated protein 13A/C